MSDQRSTETNDALQQTVAYPPFPLRGQNCQCGGCGKLFRRTSTFDRHRVGVGADRRCLTSMELTDRGWTQDSKGFWRGQSQQDRERDSNVARDERWFEGRP